MFQKTRRGARASRGGAGVVGVRGPDLAPAIGISGNGDPRKPVVWGVAGIAPAYAVCHIPIISACLSTPPRIDCAVTLLRGSRFIPAPPIAPAIKNAGSRPRMKSVSENMAIAQTQARCSYSHHTSQIRPASVAIRPMTAKIIAGIKLISDDIMAPHSTATGRPSRPR